MLLSIGLGVEFAHGLTAVWTFLSKWIVLHSLEIDFSEFSADDSRSFQFSIIILHTATYLFIRVNGQPCKTTNQKIKKLKMKFYL